MKALLILPSLILLLLPIDQAQLESKTPSPVYAMKITFQKYGEAAPMFVLLRNTGDRIRGGFARLSADPMMRTVVPDNERVSSIEGSAELVGEKWVLNFSVVIGPLVDQEPQRIASYQLSFGEPATVKELSKFQIEPFSVSIVKISSVRALQPLVINDTNSIEVTRVVVSDLPISYRVTLKNLSNKPIRALQVETLSGIGSAAFATPQGSWDRPLIDTQGSYETLLNSNSSSYRKIAPNEYEPSQAERIRISGVLFSDWTYEGDPFLAATMTANAVGAVLQIKRALKLIESALGNPGSTPEDLIASAQTLQNGVSSSALIELKDKFPTLKNPQEKLVTAAIQGSRKVKSDLISDVYVFRAPTSASNTVDFQTWLKSEKRKYEKWLSSLQ